MITVRLFAVLKDRAETGVIHLDPGPRTVADVLKGAGAGRPRLREYLAGSPVLISRNQEFADADSPVLDGDEIALMPPFSGGGERSGAVRIQEEPFSIDAELAAIGKISPSIGGIVMFLGTVRDRSGDRRVSELAFEHYPGMAEKQLAEIRDRAIRDFGLLDATIIHRVGALSVGEHIVLILTAAAHRDEAFRASRFCIDELKRITPIWKKETTPEGVVWVENHP